MVLIFGEMELGSSASISNSIRVFRDRERGYGRAGE